MNLRLLLFIFLTLFSWKSFSQEGFNFSNPKKKKESISFKFINNLIVIPIEVNGEKLSFILDTGVNKTILFDPSKKDSLHFANFNNSMLRGLGIGDDVQAVVSKNNSFKLKSLVNPNKSVFITLNNPFDFSQKMGMTIHGIIGYSLFKNLIVKVNFRSKRITFYNPKTFKYKKCEDCVTKTMLLNGNKPYIDTQISLDTVGNELLDVKLLIDTGGSDAMWLFEDHDQHIKTPKKFFNDILGEGISGHIYGKRSRLPKFKLGKFEIQNSTVSFLDSTTAYNARKFKSRNGSVGSRILKRFKIWFDYPNNKITFKKNGSFTDDFNYNMSGIDVVYNGMELVQQKEFINLGKTNKDSNSSSSVLMYTYRFKPSYRINNIVPNSPADKAGLLTNDLILRINNKNVNDLILGEILYMFQQKDNKRIKMLVKRNSENLKFEFRLKKEI